MQIYEFMVTNQKYLILSFIVHSFACIPCNLGSSIVEYIAVTYATCAFGGLSSENIFTRILDNIEFLG